MEEPPAYVKFILATTEMHKVPATILSRCQRFAFHRIRLEDIAARLRYIAEKEQIPLAEGADLQIARCADGGMRDAISLLDQCAAVPRERLRRKPLRRQLVYRVEHRCFGFWKMFCKIGWAMH